MSRLLTTKNSLRRAQITNADLAAGANDDDSMNFLFEQTNLKVLYKRSIDVCATLGFAPIFGLSGSAVNPGINQVGGQATDFRLDITIARLNTITMQEFETVGTDTNELLRRRNGTRMIQKRVLKLILILRQFLPQFKGAAAEAITAGFSNSQALNVAFESIMDGFRAAVEAQNLMMPPITTKVKILSVVKNRPLADKLFNMLTYEFE